MQHVFLHRERLHVFHPLRYLFELFSLILLVYVYRYLKQNMGRVRQASTRNNDRLYRPEEHNTGRNFFILVGFKNSFILAATEVISKKNHIYTSTIRHSLYESPGTQIRSSDSTYYKYITLFPKNIRIFLYLRYFFIWHVFREIYPSEILCTFACFILKTLMSFREVYVRFVFFFSLEKIINISCWERNRRHRYRLILWIRFRYLLVDYTGSLSENISQFLSIFTLCRYTHYIWIWGIINNTTIMELIFFYALWICVYFFSKFICYFKNWWHSFSDTIREIRFCQKRESKLWRRWREISSIVENTKERRILLERNRIIDVFFARKKYS